MKDYNLNIPIKISIIINSIINEVGKIIMSVMDKFLDVMRLNPDEDFDFDNEDFDIDEEEDIEEESYRKNKLPKKEKKPKEEVYEQPQREKAAKPAPKITPITKTTRKQALGMEVCVIKPISMEDEIEITDTLLNGRTVILNMEGLNLELAQRIIDFTSGATYAMHGNLQKISNYIFLATPNGVDISGDIQNLMDSMTTGFTV